MCFEIHTRMRKNWKLKNVCIVKRQNEDSIINLTFPAIKMLEINQYWSVFKYHEDRRHIFIISKS